MPDQPRPGCLSAYDYARLLLRDRERDLKALDRKHRRHQIPEQEYSGCRLALLQTINELGNLARQDPNRHQPYEGTESETQLSNLIQNKPEAKEKAVPTCNK